MIGAGLQMAETLVVEAHSIQKLVVEEETLEAGLIVKAETVVVATQQMVIRLVEGKQLVQIAQKELEFEAESLDYFELPIQKLWVVL